MTPKEKAKQLYDKMKFETRYNSQPNTLNVMCKELALICVDEIQKYAQMIEGTYEGYSCTHHYFVKVKEQIDLL